MAGRKVSSSLMSANVVNIADFRRGLTRIASPSHAIRERVDALTALLKANARQLAPARRKEAQVLEQLLANYAYSTHTEDVIRMFEAINGQCPSGVKPFGRLKIERLQEELTRSRLALAKASRELASLQHPPSAPTPIRKPGPFQLVEPIDWQRDAPAHKRPA